MPLAQSWEKLQAGRKSTGQPLPFIADSVAIGGYCPAKKNGRALAVPETVRPAVLLKKVIIVGKRKRSGQADNQKALRIIIKNKGVWDAPACMYVCVYRDFGTAVPPLVPSERLILASRFSRLTTDLLDA